ncbi:AraC family transcriptional regulator [Hyunsoonleella flava]|uniref:AraC family transcriptional regulator n=1 Tax=Hyunsoonleella flava TaxID=2527939 RepID=A0A4Q9FHE3_9FLAO|nr:helix-turn-helix domain-containing protein [Hyunsoonleella flava]TBN02381.1 AraC family transcriptional regulator [Hyunsoonleella flava]
MNHQTKILLVFLCVFIFGFKCNAISGFEPVRAFQIDSLIEEKNINNSLTRLELLVLYQDALAAKPSDSIEVFKNLALLNAELNQPRDAEIFSEKYISNTLDFKILSNSAYDEIQDSDEYANLKQKYLPNIHTLGFIYFYAALIGFFFAFAINTTKKGNRHAKLFIGCFIAIHSLFILEFVLFMSRLLLRFPHAYRMSSSVALLFGPLLFFYFKSVTQNFKFRAKDLLHVLPTIILLIFLIPVYAESASEKLRIMLRLSDFNSNFYDTFTFFVKIASLIFYAFCIWKAQFSKMEINKALPHKSSIKKWFKNLYRIHVAYIAAYFIYGIFAYIIKSDVSTYVYHFQIGAMSIMILYIAYMAFVQPNIFNADLNNGIDMVFTPKYEKSGLTPGLSKELKEQLIKLLVQEKIYKKSDINLEILSNKLNTTRHNTSQIINEHFKMNFFELINKFRIKEAIKILESDTHGSLNIIDVAYEVGYNNKVTFNKAFKKETSLTPTEYIQTKANLNPKVKRE